MKQTTLLSLLGLLTLGSQVCAAGGKPNILFIAVDDLRPELGCYGAPAVKSPTLDKLAGEGRLFERAYCQYAICGPSRASLLTGLRPNTLQIKDIDTFFRDTVPDCVTLPQHFKRHGYQTLYIGKVFHARQEDDKYSWDRRIPLPGKNGGYPGEYKLPESIETMKRRREEAVAKYGADAQLQGMNGGPAWEAADVPDSEYIDGRIADGAIAALRELKGGKPFFLGVGFHKPHLPFVAPKKYFDLYDPAEIERTEVRKPPANAPAIALHSSFELRTRTLVPTGGPIDDATSRQLLRAYYACASFVDAQIGRVLAELEAQGLRDNTIIVVWGDHGWHLGEYGIWGKATNFEVATRVPLIVRTPDMAKRGTKTEGLIEFIDVYPTLCELASLPILPELEGRSFAPQLQDPDAPGKDAAFSQFPSPALREWAARPLSPAMRQTYFGPIIANVETKLKREFGKRYDTDLCSNYLTGYTMRTDRYRLTLWLDDRNLTAPPLAVEFYDHEKDPHETSNVASQHPELVKQLSARLQAMWSKSPTNASDQSDGARPMGPRDTVSLDGTWEIIFDTDNKGCEAGWHDAARFAASEFGRKIPVPSCWEEHEQDYEGVAWYRRDFPVPPEWKGRHVRLHFEAINYRAELWVNGEVVGMHEGGYGPFEFDITGSLRFGESNTAIVRVVGPAIVSDQVDDLVRNATPHWRGGYVGGIWQSVKLLVSDPLHVADVFVIPGLESKEAKVEVWVANASMETRKAVLDVSVAPAENAGQTVVSQRMELTVAPGQCHTSLKLPIRDALPWSPDNPHLYVVSVRLADGEHAIDTVRTRFGMRSFTVEDGDFVLNGNRIFIKGAFWEGQYPNTLAHPRDLEIVRREIRMAKEAGFNMLRPWRMPPVPAVIDLCDEMGMLLSGAPAVENMGYWPEETPQMVRRWTDDLVAMVKRDRNHPSIVVWETANEIIRKSNLLPRHRITVAARAADPTRLIIDESGGSRAPWGSHVYLPDSSEPAPMVDRHIYLPSPVSQRDYNHLNTFGQTDQATLISEVGYGGAPDLADNVRRYREHGNPKTPDYRFHLRLLDSLNKLMDKHELRRLFPDASALCLATQKLQADGNKLQLEALRLNPKVDGYCLHAYTAGDWVTGAGVLDIWRQPKLQYQACAQVQRPMYLAIHAEPQNVYAYKGTKLTVTVVNDGPCQQAALSVSVTDGSGETRPLCNQAAGIGTGITKLLEHKLDTAGQSGVLTVTARLTNGDTTVASNSYPLFVLKIDQLKPTAERVTLIEPKQQMRKFFTGCGVEAVRFGDGENVTGPVLIAQRDAWTGQQMTEFGRLMEWVNRGGTAVWLEVPAAGEDHGQPIYRDPKKNYMMQLQGQTEPWRLASSRLIDEGVFPLNLRSRTARGMWIPVGHYVRQHPVFDGLPAGGFMGQPYQNVAAVDTITNLPGEAIAGSLSWDIDRDYRGPTQWWHGSDLAVVRHGEGRMILSMLRIVENLGRDPVADRMIMNLIRFAQDRRQSEKGQTNE